MYFGKLSWIWECVYSLDQNHKDHYINQPIPDAESIYVGCEGFKSISWVCLIQVRDVGLHFPRCTWALQASPPVAISLCMYAEMLTELGTQTWISHIGADSSNVWAIDSFCILWSVSRNTDFWVKFYNSEQGIGYSFFPSVIFEEILLKYLGFKRLKSKTYV